MITKIQKKSTKNKYYVYGYKDPDTLDYIYIGAGSGDRIDDHIRPSLYNNDPYRKYPFYIRVKILVESGNPPIREKIKEGLSRDDALALEKALIFRYGKASMRQGTLFNLNDSNNRFKVVCPCCLRSIKCSSPNFEKFLNQHFDNCKFYSDFMLRKSKPTRSKGMSTTERLLANSDTMEEYFIKRDFYGYHSWELTGGEYQDYLVDASAYRLGIGLGTWTRDIQDNFINEDLLEYSLKGISAIYV